MGHYNADWVRRHYDEYGIKEWNRWEESPVERVKCIVIIYAIM
jgi:hypothetical protein